FQGAKKGLLENSTNLCKGKHRAIVKFGAHNGKAHRAKPPLRVRCAKKARKGKARAPQRRH
ncbi:MAG: hypothetical protein WA862_03870, partial [Solirubrobacterales bacterium]